jgi:hypothetical protein
MNQRALAAIERIPEKQARSSFPARSMRSCSDFPCKNPGILDEFFTIGGIEVDWRFDETIWRAAGVAFQGYVERRLAIPGSFRAASWQIF